MHCTHAPSHPKTCTLTSQCCIHLEMPLNLRHIPAFAGMFCVVEADFWRMRSFYLSPFSFCFTKVGEALSDHNHRQCQAG